MEHVAPSPSEVERFEMELGAFALEAEKVREAAPEAGDLLDRQVDHLRDVLSLRYGFKQEVEGYTTQMDSRGRTPWYTEAMAAARPDSEALADILAEARATGAPITEDDILLLTLGPMIEITELNSAMASHIAKGKTYTSGWRLVLNSSTGWNGSEWVPAPPSPPEVEAVKQEQQKAVEARLARLGARVASTAPAAIAEEDRFLRLSTQEGNVSFRNLVDMNEYPDAEDPYVAYEYYVDNANVEEGVANLRALLEAGGLSDHALTQVHSRMLNATKDRMLAEGALPFEERHAINSTVQGKISPKALQAFVELTADKGDDFRLAVLAAVQFDGDMALLISATSELIDSGISAKELYEVAGSGSFGTARPVAEVFEVRRKHDLQRRVGRAAATRGVSVLD